MNDNLGITCENKMLTCLKVRPTMPAPMLMQEFDLIT